MIETGLFITLLAATFAAVSAAPWVPAFKRDIQAVLDDAGIEPGQVVYELGSGDGRLLVAAAKRGASVIGYEINPILYAISWFRLLPYRRHAHVRFQSLWSAKLQKADIVIAFLVPRTVPRLYSLAENTMKPGSIFVSYIFEVPEEKPIKKGAHWFVYRIRKRH